ncbi:MAG: hypothetical protein ABSG53_10380, partial [Thermoguttaceae bacterium]
QTAGAQQALDDRVAGLDALRVDLESQQLALEKDRRQWELQRGEAAAALSAEAERLATREAELDAQSRELEEERAALEGRKTEAGRQMEDRELQLQNLKAELSAQVERLHEQPRQYEARLTELQTRENELEERRSELDLKIAAAKASAVMSVEPVSALIPSASAPPTSESQAETRHVANAQTARTIAPPNAAPGGPPAILRQTVSEIEPADEKEQSDANANRKDEAPNSPAVEKRPIDVSAPVPQSRTTTGLNAAEDVSVDDYMSRLLARSRGDSAQPSARTTRVSRASAAASPAGTSQSSPPPVVPESQGEHLMPVEPLELAPHAVAPERQADLKAMRQLANLSAKSALHKHENKQLSGKTRTKLLVTSVSGIVGVSLLVIHQLPGAPPVTIYGALASFAVVALWGVNYVLLTSRMAGARLAYLGRRLKVDEEPAEEVEKGDP